MLVASSSKFCLRRCLIFSTSKVFVSVSLFLKPVVIGLCQGLKILNSYMAHLLSRENKRALCLFVRLSSSRIRGPSRSENKTRHFACHVVHEVRVKFSSPASTLHAWNAWDHDPPFGDEPLAIYYSGFRVIIPFTLGCTIGYSPVELLE